MGVILPGPVMKSILYSRLVRFQTERFAGLLKRSGRVGSPSAMAAESAKNTILSTLTFTPAAALLGWFVSPWCFAIAATPLAIMEAPELGLRDLVAQRREGVERELPFFAILVSVLGTAGIPLYSVLREIAAGDTFRWIGREALLVKRDVEILGMNAIDSFERLASNHPSKGFGEFLLGYSSKVRSGGDLPLYLVGESGNLLGNLEQGWARYAARVGIVGSMMVTLFGVVPLLLMVVGIFSPGFSILGLVIFTGVGVPLFTMGLLYMTGRMQPMDDEPIGGKAGRSLLISLPGAAIGFLTGALWAAVASVLFIFFVAYGLSVKGQMADTREVEEGVSLFLKDLLEYKRQEYDLSKAIVTIESQRSYNAHFAKVLSTIASRLRAGVPLDEAKVSCRSRVGRLTFLLLGQMSRSGGGTVDTLFQVSHFANKLLEMRRVARAEMKPYLVLSYLAPLLLAFGVAFVGAVLSSFSRTVTPGLADLPLAGTQIGNVPPSLSQVSDLLIVVSAASLGLIGAKLTDLTVKSTLQASANVGLAMVSITVLTFLGSHSLTPLFLR